MRPPRRAPAPLAALAAALIACGVAAAPARAAELSPPLSPEARALYDAGMAHYSAKEYEAAIAAFVAAYAAEPRREILFARAQATRLGGDCPRALELYERFLATAPPARQVEATRIAVARCAATRPPEAAAARSPDPAAVEPAAPGEPPSGSGAAPAAGAGVDPLVKPGLAAATGAELGALLVPPVAPPAPARPWYRDPAGGALAAAAVVAAAVGVGLLSAARSEEETGRAAGVYAGYAEHREPAERRARWGLAGVVVGGALGACAVGRYLWLGLGADGHGVRAEGRF